jgi:hypothetical protein
MSHWLEPGITALISTSSMFNSIGFQRRSTFVFETFCVPFILLLKDRVVQQSPNGIAALGQGWRAERPPWVNPQNIFQP